MQKSHNLSLKSKKSTDKWVFLRKQENGTVNKHLTFLPSVKQKNNYKESISKKYFFFKLLFHFVNLVLTGFTSGEELQLLVH